MNPSTTLRRALDAREPLLERLGDDTDAVRLLHGIAEGWPGVAVDRYGPVLLVQTWRDPLEPGTLEALHDTAQSSLGVPLTPVWNHRRSSWEPDSLQAECIEHGLRFDATPRHRGIDPLLFLDFRVARREIRSRARGKTVLNCFAYTCGISVAALAGGATRAVNLDFATSSLEIGRQNAVRNDVQDGFETIQSDYFPAIRQLAGLAVGGRRGKRPRFPVVEREQFDIVVLDPPRWARSPWGAVDVVRDYPSLLKPALLAAADGGQVLATNNHAGVALEDWLAVVRRTAEKAGRPIRSLDVWTPDDDFPSFDGSPPLKLAWMSL